MSVEYKVVSKANPQNREEIKFYLQPLKKGIISRAKLEEGIVRETSLSKGDVRSVMAIFSDLVFDYLSEGYTVRLEEVGLLSLKVRSKGEEKAEDINAKSVNNIGIGFRQAPEMHEKLLKTKFERAKNSGA